MIDVQGSRESLPPTLVCPTCGNRTDFDVLWLNSVTSRLSIDPATGEGDYDNYADGDEIADVNHDIQCNACEAVIATRDIHITVGPWRQSVLTDSHTPV